LACPECGSDENTGWSEETLYDGLNLPEHETGITQTKGSLLGNKNFICIVTVVVVIAIVLVYIF